MIGQFTPSAVEVRAQPLRQFVQRLGLLMGALLCLACSKGDGLVMAPTQDGESPLGAEARHAYDSNQFFAATGVDRFYSARYGAENSYDITLRGFVGNTNSVGVSDVRVMVQLFNATGDQIGVQILTTKPSSLGISQFSQYAATFGPFTNPSNVSWYRVTPYNRRGKGLVLEQAMGL